MKVGGSPTVRVHREHELNRKNLRMEVLRDVRENLATTKKLENLVEPILAAARRTTQTLRRGGKVIIFGNGGSAAEAQHIAAELIGKYGNSRAPLAAVALTTNTSVITAVANDFSYEEVFARQVEALATRRDLVIAISTRGTSENVIRAVRIARRIGAVTVGLTGGAGGKLVGLVDLAIVVPSRNVQRIQEAHNLIGHAVCRIVEKELKKK